MVVFTCAHCGESVNKPKVEKHYATKCRGRAPNLSCMDCFKDFFGNEHESHTKCISEAQRYGGVGFVDTVKKGEQKQSTWVELVQAALDESLSAPPAARRILEEVSKHSNTPRKKPKFVNFVRNVCGHRTMPKDIDAAWDVLAVQLERLKSQQAQKPENQHNGQAKSADATTTNGDVVAEDTNIEEEPVKSKKKEKKRKLEATADSTQEQQQKPENLQNGQGNPVNITATDAEIMEADTKSEEGQVRTNKKDKKRKLEATVDSTQEKLDDEQNGQDILADTTTTNGESKGADSKTEDEPLKTKKKRKNRKIEASADSTQEPQLKPENQQNGQYQPADTTTANSMEVNTKNEDGVVKTKKKGKRKLETTADSTQEQQKSENQPNGHVKPADTTTTNREIVEADTKTEDEPVKSKKKEKRKLEANADSTQEVTQNVHTTNGESAEAGPVPIKKQRKEDKKKSKQEASLDDRPAVNGESEGKKKKKRNHEEITSTEDGGNDNTKNQAVANEAPPPGLDTTTEDKFDWSAVLMRLVQDAGGRLSVAKLKKRLLKEYTATGKSAEKAKRRFEKRLKTVTELRVEDGNVVFAI